MTRLSDSLRGLADRAPIDHATVSVAGAARRIQRGRRLRAAANATAGVGVAAVVALAALHPGGSTPLTSAEGADAGKSAGGADAPAIASMEDDGAYLWEWGACGSLPLHEGDPTVGDAATLQMGLTADAFEPGELVSAQLTLAPKDNVGELSTPGIATVIVLWEGYAVARTDVTAAYTDGVADIQASLANCWDGSMLPAGDYQMVVVHDVYPTLDVAVEDNADAGEGVEGLPEPAATPSTSADPNPDDSVSIAVEPQLEVQRVVSNIVSFEITGDRLDNPFDAYLWGTQPTDYPEDYLTPDAARGEYAARVSREPWNMAAGTQRVVMIHDGLSGDPVDYPNSRYFGCPWDGVGAQGFPQESAKWDLLGVKATLPKQLSLSYGWVVDDNPEVALSVTNLSEYSLPGFWSEPHGALILVKDGKVMAETYLTSIDRYGAMNAPGDDGMLAPGTVLESRFLWREASGCWIGNNATPVEPGTYTVLNMQSLYLDNGANGMYAEPYLSDGAEAEGGEVRTAIAPFPTVDYVEMQVWTSLGTITVN